MGFVTQFLENFLELGEKCYFVRGLLPHGGLGNEINFIWKTEVAEMFLKCRIKLIKDHTDKQD